MWLDLVSGVLALVVNTIGASIVPVGGGLGNDAGLVAALDVAVRARILRRTEAPLVVPAQISTDAGLVGAATAGGAAHEQGMLMPGMLADIAVLDHDPFKIDSGALHAIQADMTILEGQVVWERRGT